MLSLTRASSPVNLLRLEGRHDESASLLHQLALLSVTDEDKADESKLLASIQFTDLLKRFNADPVLGMISDSGMFERLNSSVNSRVDSVMLLGSAIDSNARHSRRRCRQSYLTQKRADTPQLPPGGGDAAQ